MASIITKLFIKDYQNTKDEKVRSKYGAVSGTFGIITNLFLAILKITVGLITASVAVLSDGINNFSDSGSSLITLLGFKLSQKKADSKHPFGHERIEYITGMIISFIIIFVGLTLGKEGISSILNPGEDYQVSFIIIFFMFLSILVKVWQFVVYKSMGKAIHSETLIASSIDSLSDCISTFAVIISMIVYLVTKNTMEKPINIDGYAGLIVSIFIIINGIKLIISTSSPLLGESSSQEIVDDIYNTVVSYPGVLGVHDLVIHNYGPNRTFITLHVEVDSRVNVLESHEVIDNIERDFKIKRNMELTIHMDPIDNHDERTLNLREKVASIVSSLCKDAKIHDFRVVWGETHSNILFDIAISYEDLDPEKLKNQVILKIKEINPTYNPIIGVDQGYDHIVS
jgi:cation diffusion facilitator family transporter